MNVTITKTEEQPLLKRKELHATISYQGATPARHEFMKAVAEKQGVKPTLIQIKQAASHFGSTGASVVAYQYENAQALEKNAPDYLKKRNVIPEPPAPEPEPEPEEAPAEESSEEETSTEESEEKAE